MSGRRIDEARDEIRQVCEWLSRPSAETMEACAPALERAVARVNELSVDLQPGMIEDLRALAVEIHVAHVLLAAAGELHCGRMRRLAVL